MPNPRLVQSLPMRPSPGPDHRSPQSAFRRSCQASQRWIAATGLSIFFALAATAAEPRDESHRWVPSTSLFFDALGQKLDGAVKTGQVLGPPLSLGGCLGSLPNGTTTTRTPGLCPTARG